MKKITLMLLLTFVLACQKEGSDDSSVEPLKPQDEYTKESPGEWEPLAKDHVPKVALKGKLDPNNIQITIPGSEFGQSHYIEKVGILDKNKNELVGKSLEKGETEARLTFKYDLDELKDTKVYIKCNLHDVWTITLDKAELKK